jgi:Zn-dependent protease with chaperone function
MDANTTSPVAGRRLNPFPFPSDTTLRFALLAIFVICGSAALHGNMHDISEAATLECSREIWSSASDEGLANGDADAVANTADVIVKCMEYLRPAAWWKIAGMLVAVAIAAVVYHAGPSWIARSRRLEPITTANSLELEAELRGLVATAGLDRTPEFLWNPLAAGLPTVFGHRGRFRIALSGAFVSQAFLGDRARFRAIMLHELAHIRTGDVPKTYLSIALLVAFFATALLPALVVTVGRLAAADWAGAFHMLFQSVFWSVIAILAGLSVLRAREYYADVQASVWQRGPDLERMLETLPRPSGGPWWRYLSFHPDPAERLRVVGDPSRLFGLGFADAFGIGVAAWLIIDVATFVISPLVPLQGLTGLFVFMGIKAILTLAILVIAIGAIGIGVWRGAFAQLMTRRSPYRGAAGLGLALVLGALPGRMLVVADAYRMSGEVRAPLYPTLVLTAAIDLLLLMGCVMIFRWIAGTASAWFEVVVRNRSPQPVVMASVGAALLLVLGTLGSASFAVYFYFLAMSAVRDLAQFGYLAAFIIGVPVFVASVIAWAFPFAAKLCARRRRSDGPAPWLFLDDGGSEIPEQAALSVASAAVTGVVLGLLYWLAFELVFFRSYLPDAMAGAIAAAFDAYVAWVIGLTGDAGVLFPGTAAVVQAFAAVIASAKAVRLRVLHGLCAASCCGLVITAGNILFFGLAPPIDLYGIAVTGLVLLGLGGAVALGAAIVAAEVGRLASRVLPGLWVPGGRKAWLGAFALLVAVVLGLMVVRVSEHLAVM